MACAPVGSLTRHAAANTTAAQVPARAAAAPGLLPAPTRMEWGNATFALNMDTPVRAEGEAAQAAARAFSDYVRRTHGMRLPPAQSARVHGTAASAPPAILFRLEPAADTRPLESYRIEVDSRSATVTAADPAGLFYGAVSLWQLVQGQAGDQALHLPAVRIEDAPRLRWRGLMLDSARHLQSVGEIKRLLDAMAWHKLNVFHWHLTDDQGWRVEIKRYPRLTEVGGCRTPATAGPQGGPPPYCGHYTQEQIREIVRYAAERHITVVPEIDVPGHAQAAIAAYPELGTRDTKLPVSNEWGVHTHLYNVEERTFEFLDGVMSEVVELFPGPYVHLGGDEAVKDAWRASPRVQARMRELGLPDENALQAYFVRRVADMLARRGRRAVGWDEILDGGAPEGAIIMSWRGTTGGIEAATRGHDVVMTPQAPLYLDYQQSASSAEPAGRPKTNTLHDIVAFDPVPSELQPSQAGRVIGLQGNVWTEHMRVFERVEHAIFPRLAAVAEVAWSPDGGDWADFARRLPTQLERYRRLDIDYASTGLSPVIDATPAPQATDRATVRIAAPAGFDDVRYTVDGSAPTADSPRYQGPFDVALPARIQASVLVDGTPLAPAVAYRVDAERLAHRRGTELTPCGDGLRLRLEDDGPYAGERAVYPVDLFDACWQWPGAPLHTATAVEVRAGRIPYAFQLHHDESKRIEHPAETAHGELDVRAGCDGPRLARIALPATTDADGFARLQARLPARPAAGPATLCLRFTGPTRPAMWVIDEVRLIPAGTRP